MKKEELWDIFTKKNPGWKDEGANLTPAGIKKLFDTTYEQGHKQGVLNGKALAGKDHAGKTPDFLKGLFGTG